MNSSQYCKYQAATPEETVILLCLYATFEPQNHKEITETIQKNNIDWDKLIFLGKLNKILPLLYFHLSSSELIPAQYLDYLRSHCTNNTKNNLFITAELIKILKLCNVHKIPVLILKGPVLAISLYKSIVMRESGDLDLIVYKKDINKISELLKSEGYETVFEITEVQEKAYFKYHRQLHLKNKAGIHLDIHSSIAPNHFSENFKLNQDLWSRYKEITIYDEKVKCLSMENLLFILCIHAHKHMWSELRWVIDIAQLINKNKDLDWIRINQKAKDLGIEKSLIISAYLINFLLDIEVPEHILNKADAKIKLIVKDICKRLLTPLPHDTTHYSFKDMFLFQFKTCDSFIQKMQYFIYFIKIIISPSFGDWQSVKLPDFLYPLYYFIRPFRLAFKFRPSILKSKIFSGFLPTSFDIANRLLEFAEVTDSDIVYDLGCGDGRLIIHTAKHFHAKGVGVDLDPELIQKASLNAKKENVEKLTNFIQEDATITNIKNASIVVLYLPGDAMQKLKPKLLKELKPGAKIISHGDSPFKDLPPSKIQVITDSKGNIHPLYMWEIDKIRNKLNKKISAEQEAVTI